MKAYFTASISAKEKYIANYKQIIEYLKSLKHTVVADHILNSEETTIMSSSREEILEFHKKLEEWIRTCDFVIAETSFPSISVGYEISLALRLGKPVLILFSEGGPPSLFAFHKDEKLITEKYTQQTYKDIIHDFITFVENKTDLRFTFFITPSIAMYMDEVSKKQKLPKSVYLRKLIEKDMKENS